MSRTRPAVLLPQRLALDAGQNDAGQNDAGQNDAGQNDAGQKAASQNKSFGVGSSPGSWRS